LTYAEKGLWIDLIGRTVNSPKQGHYFTALQKLAGCGTCEAVWKLLMNLAVKGVADIYVEGESGEVDQKVTCENARKYATATVDDYTRVIVVGRRVVREAEARSREAERTAKRRAGSERHMPDRTRTETGQNPDITPDTDRTEPGHYPGQNPDITPDRTRTETGIYHLLPSSPYLPSEDTGLQEPSGKKKPSEKRTGRVSENTPLMVRIGKWFGMRETTLWTVEQSKKLKDLAPAEDEIAAHEAFYAIEDDPWRNYRRRDLSTQLNNWVDDLTKHREWTREWETSTSKSRKSAARKDVPAAVC
jgi:hypothetical protein